MNPTLSHFRTTLQDIVFQYQYHQVVRYVVSFVVSVIMVRSALPQTDLGRYEIMLFIIVSISSFWSNGIKNALVSYYNTIEETNKQILLWTVFFILSAISIIVSLILLFFPETLSIFDAEVLIPFLPAIAIYLLLFSSLPLIETIYLLKKESKKLWYYTHWSQLGLIILTGLTALIQPTLNTYFFILIFWSAIRWLYLVFYILKPNTCVINSKQLFIFGLFALPLVLNMVLGSAMEMIDGLFVTNFFEADFFPVFRYGAREMPLASLLFGSLSLGMIPLLSQNMSNISLLKSKATKHMHLLAPISIVLMVISPYVFPWVYGQEYKESAFIFNIYLLIMISRIMLPQTICFAKHQHAVIIWSGIIEIVANIILSFWWLKLWGVYGLAMGTIVAFAIQKFILIIYNYRVNGIRVTQYIEIKPYLIYSFLLIITFYITLTF